MKKKWIKRFTDLAQYVAQWSKDPNTKVGAVITKKNRIISLGYNGAPAKVKDSVRHNRVRKNRRTIHAEVNAILFASRRLKGCSMFVTHHPCSQCAAKIIACGIKRVYCPEPTGEFAERWKDDIEEARSMFKEASVKLVLQ